MSSVKCQVSNVKYKVMQTSIILILNVIVGAVGNILFKVGAGKLPAFEVKNFLADSWRMISNPYILAGIILLALNFPLYSFLIQKMKLAVAFPLVTSLTFFAVVLISFFSFKESLNAAQYIGIALLTAGLWLLAR